LICPACTAGGRLESAPGGLRCGACQRLHPILDQVPIVMGDLDGYLAEHGAALAARGDLPPPVAARLRRFGPPSLRAGMQAAAAALRSPADRLHHWALQQLTHRFGAVLHLSCGVVGLSAPQVINLDHRWPLLRHATGHRLLADPLRPPFAPDSFEAVVMLGALEASADPAALLAVADTMLQPGGLLLLGSAFAYDDAVTPPLRQVGEDRVIAFFETRGYAPRLGELNWMRAESARVKVHISAMTLTGRKPSLL